MEMLILLAFMVGAIYIALTRLVLPKKCLGCGRARVPGTDVCPFCHTAYRTRTGQSFSARAYLTRVTGTGQREHFEIAGDALEIGRGEDNNLCVQDPSVARHHAVIVRQGRDYMLYDRSSPSGTYVNGRRVAAQVLRPGDRIQVGSSVLIFNMPATAMEPGALTFDRLSQGIQDLTVGRKVSGAGALLALFCFFLPWIVMSCGVQVSMSGLDLATSPAETQTPSWVLFLVPLMAGAVLWTLYAAIDKPVTLRRGVAKRILGLSGLGMLPVILTYLAVQRARNDPANFGLGALIRLEYGFWGTAMGFVTSMIGALLEQRELQ